jgi:uncharacterized surface protein with fasciclin (FAS1) repeats
MSRIKINLAAVLCLVAVNGAFAQESSVAGSEASDVMTLIADEPALTEYVSMIETAGLSGKLNSLEGSTIFIPTNEAIDEYRNQTGNSLDDVSAIEQFVFANIFGEAIAPEMYPANGVLNNLSGSSMTLSEDEQVLDNTFPVEYLGMVADAAGGSDVKLYVYVMKEYNAVSKS